ncbi:zinc-binding dehydrogenase [Halomonas vilamensis]|uniref:Zinc-binding dehydrogenase n=1 Tax=Vreelandella vilamensis TaxID=531309 RepID=A0ABU1H7H0_9GAMM|nr:zinc-binding dehydrogenase [Halomonas vilamensis]MDR5900248.1 zinc-binding dehydrogenase [Halomonas vilamensis]
MAKHFDAGHLRSTLSEVIGPLTPENLGHAHRKLEEGHVTGKLVNGNALALPTCSACD